VSSVRTNAVRLFGRAVAAACPTVSVIGLLSWLPPAELSARTMALALFASGAVALAVKVNVSIVLGAPGFGLTVALIPDGNSGNEYSNVKLEAEELVVNCVEIVPPCAIASWLWMAPTVKLGGTGGGDVPSVEPDEDPPPQPYKHNNRIDGVRSREEWQKYLDFTEQSLSGPRAVSLK
jgi:hypothetical protein